MNDINKIQINHLVETSDIWVVLNLDTFYYTVDMRSLGRLQSGIDLFGLTSCVEKVLTRSISRLFKLNNNVYVKRTL